MAINREFMLDWQMEPVIEQYSEKDAMFYALSLGIGMDPLDPKQLQYVYEDDNLKIFPTYPVVLCSPQGWALNPDAGLNYRMMVHSEQTLKIHQPLPRSGTLKGITRVVDVLDKGEDRGALVYLAREIYDNETGEHLATVGGTAFARADGGFGGPSGPVIEPHKMPEGPAEQISEIETSPQAALLYRLNGDRNPIHASPEIAKSAKFPQPILHGMATYSISAAVLLDTYAEGRPEALKELNARFSKPLFPGEKLTIESWRKGQKISFRVRVAERDVTVLDNGYAVLDI